MIRQILIANRGEIALRIIRACRELGIRSVAVYSEVDAGALHVVSADRAIPIGPAAAAESYLAIPKLIDAARATGADAIHPGYGFLAENAAFAAACEQAGVIFIGPPSKAMALMGSKIEARRLMDSVGVPVVPGATPADQSDEEIARVARQIGFPVLIKASAGGGGKGMRRIATDRDLREGISAARREATAAFGDGTLYVERYIERPRHVEFQILGDARGQVVHLFERECSVQRRHQKVIEESPSPALTPALRRRMGEAAVRAARAAGYRSAGTIEFLLAGEGDYAPFYFLEMNARLQVEHPVTEAVTGVDLVHAQIAVADGRPLPWTQNELTQRGHAVECRIYAEDPFGSFLPQAGRITLYRQPSMPGVRIDSGVAEGSDVPVYYDPILAKLVACAETRPAAIARAAAALREFPILGLRTNIPLLCRILEHRSFVEGDAHTDFLDREAAALFERRPIPAAAAAAVAFHSEPSNAAECQPEGQNKDSRGATSVDPWVALKGWRG